MSALNVCEMMRAIPDTQTGDCATCSSTMARVPRLAPLGRPSSGTGSTRTVAGKLDAPTPDETPGASRAYGDRDLSDTSWTEEERPQSADQPVAQREVRRPPASTAQDDELLLEQEILGDDRSHATGAHSFAVTTAR